MAAYIDLILITAIAIIIEKLLIPKPYEYPEFINYIFVFLPPLIQCCLLFLRDVNAFHRSIGKIIMKLIIVDQNSHKIVSNKTLFCRNLLEFCTLPINILTILVKNKSVSDYVLETKVISN